MTDLRYVGGALDAVSQLAAPVFFHFSRFLFQGGGF
jgi:hypothetical protein